MRAPTPLPLTTGGLVESLRPLALRLHGAADVELRGVTQDSRRVQPGELFAVRPGQRTSGAEHLGQALAAGAAAVLAPASAFTEAPCLPWLEVSDVSQALSAVSEAIYGHPSRALDVVGITGTNGKTTTAWLAQHALVGAGRRTARLGTLGYSFEAEDLELGFTTPEADALSRVLARARGAGADTVVMEVSSHALSLGRVEALTFRVAAFTNLTQDHLDFHGDLERYGAAKRRLFTDLAPARSVVNVDDPFGARLAQELGERALRVSRLGDGDVRPLELTLDGRGLHGRVRLPSAVVELESRLVGAHNLDNVLLCLGIAEALGLDLAAAALALSAAPSAPGRLERCDEPGDDVIVLVDYAHTPDALRRALAAARPLARGRLCCVFGCGGDRDPGKRPLMGRAVAEGADLAFVTNDNPRSEDPGSIAGAIERGLREGGGRYVLELDRQRAIEQAITEAAAGDVVLIAGKGHEPYQQVGELKRPFDDRVEARGALRRRRGGR